MQYKCPFTAMPSLPTAFHKTQADLNAYLALTSGLRFGGTAAEMPTGSVSAPRSSGLEMGGHTSLCFLILQVHRYPSNSIFLSFSCSKTSQPPRSAHDRPHHLCSLTCCLSSFFLYPTFLQLVIPAQAWVRCKIPFAILHLPTYQELFESLLCVPRYSQDPVLTVPSNFIRDCLDLHSV